MARRCVQGFDPWFLNTHSAVTGAPGARLLGLFEKAVGVPTPRGILRPALSPFQQNRGSLRSAGAVTLPLHRRM